MIFAPAGLLARLLFGDWRVIVVANDNIIVRAENKETRVHPLSLRDVVVVKFVFWARLTLTAADGSTITLTGISLRQAEKLRAQIWRHRAEAVGNALESFYAAPRYLAAYDVDKWLRSQPPIKKSLGLINHHPVAYRLHDIGGSERRELRERNKQFVKREMRECAAFFDGVEKMPLTDEQRYAAVVMEDRNLLTAAAGSGKTSALVGKIGYALHRGMCRPEEIVALAFNKKAAAELRERINARLANLGGERVSVETFHALGLRIIGEASGKKPRVAEWAAALGENINRQTDALINELAAANGEFCSLLGQLYAIFRWAVKPRTAFQTEDEYERHLEKLIVQRTGEERFPTIKGDKVKSMEECVIANFLHCNGVRYEYEKNYEHDVADAAHGQYRPDFYYPDAGLYHEHFGLDEKGEAPAFMGGAEYARQAEWKQNLHGEKGTKLLVTTSAQFHRGDLLCDLRRRLQEHGVAFGGAMPPAIIRGWLRRQESRPIYKLMSDFLSRWKACGKSIGRLYAEAEQLSGFARIRAVAFLGAMDLLRGFYERKLRANNEVDFEDMLALAADKIHSGACAHPYQLILVDEFQDISFARAKLIKAMLDQRRECKLFAVGDDWQAIYRFAGADIGIMRDFAAEFGATSHAMLTQTFRSNQGITDVASAFVCANPMQMKKTVYAADSSRAGVIAVLHYEYDDDVVPFIQSKLENIAARDASECKTVLILGRYNLRAPMMQAMLTQKQIKEWQRHFCGELTIDFSTAHKAKGLEADYVFILGMNGGKYYGFPNEMEDDELLSLVMTKGEDFEFAEERRLFYVTLTRAKRQSYLLARLDSPSRFVNEINAEHKDGEILNEADIGGKMAQVRLCPECQSGGGQTGFLLLRKERRGAFYGCSNWRADNTGCAYKEKIKPARR